MLHILVLIMADNVDTGTAASEILKWPPEKQPTVCLSGNCPLHTAAYNYIHNPLISTYNGPLGQLGHILS